MIRFLLVCLGGAAGSGARYLVSLVAISGLGLTFPYGTMFVNVIGSFLIGCVMEVLPANDLRLLLVTGVLGGFTTYSSFNQESLQMLRGPAPWLGVLNIGATVVLCLVAGVAGMAVGRRL